MPCLRVPVERAPRPRLVLSSLEKEGQQEGVDQAAW